MTDTNKPYCRPWNAGLDSETPAVCRRLGHLIAALHDEINNNIVQGEICDELRSFSYSLQTKLENEGWSFSYDGGNRLKVRNPGHKNPFNRRTKEG